MKCPKCSAEDARVELPPNASCPACGAVYAKAIAAAVRRNAAEKEAAHEEAARRAEVAAQAEIVRAAKLMQCPACGHQCSKTAAACPSCGHPLGTQKPAEQEKPAKRTSLTAILAALVLVPLAISAAFESCSSDDSRDRRAAVSSSRSQQSAQCRKDLRCWAERHDVDAQVRCKRTIERLANFSSEWTGSILQPMFTRFAWADQAAGTVTYYGDSIRFQNGFGAWQNMVYACTYNPATDTAEAAAEAGTL